MKLTEDQMEKYLLDLGYDLWVGDQDDRTIDSTLTIDYAIEEGFKSKINEDTGEIVFSKRY